MIETKWECPKCGILLQAFTNQVVGTAPKTCPKCGRTVYPTVRYPSMKRKKPRKLSGNPSRAAASRLGIGGEVKLFQYRLKTMLRLNKERREESC